MNKLASALALAILGLVVLAATSRALIALAGALATPIVACAVAIALLRYVWWLTGSR